MAKTYYAVNSVKPNFPLRVGGFETSLSASGLADGCKGVLLVFKNKKEALKYAKLCGDNVCLTKFSEAPKVGKEE